MYAIAMQRVPLSFAIWSVIKSGMYANAWIESTAAITATISKATFFYFYENLKPIKTSPIITAIIFKSRKIFISKSDFRDIFIKSNVKC